VTVGCTFPPTLSCTGLWRPLLPRAMGSSPWLTAFSSDRFSLTRYSLPPPDSWPERKSHIPHRWCSSLIQGPHIPRFPSLTAALNPPSSRLRSQVLFGSWDPQAVSPQATHWADTQLTRRGGWGLQTPQNPTFSFQSKALDSKAVFGTGGPVWNHSGETEGRKFSCIRGLSLSIPTAVLVSRIASRRSYLPPLSC